MPKKYQFLGDNKYIYYHVGTADIFSFYDVNDNEAIDVEEVDFYLARYFNDTIQQADIVYMVGFPKSSEKLEALKKLISNEEIDIFYHDWSEALYFKITKEQYDELSKDLFESRKRAEEDMEEVTYSYKELFGDFEESN